MLAYEYLSIYIYTSISRLVPVDIYIPGCKNMYMNHPSICLQMNIWVYFVYASAYVSAYVYLSV